MSNFLSIVEIPVMDFSRALNFYQNILGLELEAMDMAGTQMGIFPAEEDSVNVVLVQGEGYVASTQGPVVYLNAGNQLQNILDKVAENGGQILQGKSEISPEMGYYALFLDVEGNRIGLHGS